MLAGRMDPDDRTARTRLSRTQEAAEQTSCCVRPDTADLIFSNPLIKKNFRTSKERENNAEFLSPCQVAFSKAGGGGKKKAIQNEVERGRDLETVSNHSFAPWKLFGQIT